jgi:hypothetical protein
VTTPARLPRASGPASPAAVARQLLTWVEAWWGEHQDTDDPDAPQPLPEARYLAGGDPRTVAWDHDAGQLTVAMDRIVTGTTDPTASAVPARSPRTPAANQGRIVRHSHYEVQIVRAAPGLGFAGAIPGGTAIDAHGYLLMSDAGHLLTCLRDGLRDGAFLREHVGQGNVILGDAESLGPSGALAGVACGLNVPLL